MTTHETDDQLREGEEAPPRGVRTMAIVRWVLVVMMGLVAAGSILYSFGVSLSGAGAASKAGAKLYYCPMHPQIVQDHPGECPICSMTLVPKPEGPVKPSTDMGTLKGSPSPPAMGSGGQSPPPPHAHTMQPATTADGGAVGKYYCPMHPEISSDDPNAKCDKCGGMKLMPRPQAQADAGPPVPGLVPVDIPIERVQKIGIRTARVTRERVTNDLRTVGVVEANERGQAQVSPRFSGWIEKLHAAETGQKVRKGQPLAAIYSPEVLQAQQEFLTALGWSGNASTPEPHEAHLAAPQGLAADARRRLELLGVSPQEIDAVAKAKKPMRAIPLRSPVDGYVINKHAVVGMAVSPGMPLFEVADLSTVWVVADVYESEVARIRVGQPARFEVAAYPGETFTGKVQFIYPTMDPSARTLRARLEVRNRPAPGAPKLRPGMYGNVLLDLPATTGLMVPAEAVADTGDLQYVFVTQQGGRFEPRRIKLGSRVDDKFEVLQGLTDGEVVVTTANFLIDSESRLRAAIEGQGRAAVTPAESTPAPGQGADCAKDFDPHKYPDKARACRACEVQHRGMGTMEEDCKKTIPKPWR